MNYRDLEVEVRRYLAAEGKNQAQVNKVLPILNLFRESLNRSEEAKICEDLLGDNSKSSEQQFRTYLEHVYTKPKGGHLSPSTIDSYVSFAKTNFIALYQNTFSVMAILAKPNFAESLALLRERKKLSRADLSEKMKVTCNIEISEASIRSLEEGTSFPRNDEIIKGIESVLEVPRDCLSNKVPLLERTSLKHKGASPTRSSELNEFYMYTLAKNHSSTRTIEDDIEELLRFKSADASELIESGITRGTRSAHKSEGSTETVRDKLLQYAGYLTLSKVGENELTIGKGYNPDTIRLPDFLKIENIKGYAEFLALRAFHSNKPRKTPASFINFLKSLLDICSNEGFLIQFPDKFDGYNGFPNNNPNLPWNVRVGRQYNSIKQYMNDFISSAPPKTNDKLEYLNPILSQPRPIEALVNVINNIEKDIQKYTSLGEQYIPTIHHLRMYQAFFAIEACYPFRITHINKKILATDLTISTSKDGDIFHLALRKNDFKNKYNPNIKDTVEELRYIGTRELRIDVTEILKQYISLSRPYFFELANKTENRNRLFPVTLTSYRHQQYTKTYSGFSMGWNFHSNRHIVATDKVKHFFKNGKSGYLFAAAALFDSEKTISKTYAKFGPTDINKLAKELELEQEKIGIQGASASAPENSVRSEHTTKLEWITGYVKNEASMLINMSNDELSGLFPDDPTAQRHIKSMVSALRRSKS
ncbi:helix-turn-helix domain-containing protein [Bdellovibrio sp. HCB185ZH]|uniref:helix-turn-helix domain-containing protein n=1 Tax=Bdellovibrio sp. HCB185ZH TaxID=3394235 RepID=UPI0039A5EA30